MTDSTAEEAEQQWKRKSPYSTRMTRNAAAAVPAMLPVQGALSAWRRTVMGFYIPESTRLHACDAASASASALSKRSYPNRGTLPCDMHCRIECHKRPSRRLRRAVDKEHGWLEMLFLETRLLGSDAADIGPSLGLSLRV